MLFLTGDLQFAKVVTQSLVFVLFGVRLVVECSNIYSTHEYGMAFVRTPNTLTICTPNAAELMNS